MSSPALQFPNGIEDTQVLRDEILSLQQKLQAAQSRINTLISHPPLAISPTPSSLPPSTDLDAAYLSATPTPAPTPSHLHALLLLSDSALPLGAFAYSSGLESFLAHHPRTPTSPSPTTQLTHFLSISLHSLTTTTVPYLIAGYLFPSQLPDLDNDLDASTPCTVARRASVKQGLALLAVWERSFRARYHQDSQQPHHDNHNHKANINPIATASLSSFSTTLKSTHHTSNPILTPNGHLPPLFGVLCSALRVPLAETLYIYLFNHAKTIISAAVRAGVLGPYQAQGILAGLGEDVSARVDAIIAQHDVMQRNLSLAGMNGGEEEEACRLLTEGAGQAVPMLDLWGGRHEIIYSRIFNS